MLKSLIILIFISLLIFSSCEQKKDEKKTTASQVVIAEQSEYNRKFIDVKFKEKLTINTEKLKIYYPIALRLDDEENIYVYDLSEQKIKMVKGDKVIEFGEGKGNGPREFGNIIDYKILGNTVYIAGSSSNKISLFKKNGEFIKTVKVKTRLHRMEIFKDNIVTTADPFKCDNYFQLLDRNFKEIKSFAKRIYPKGNNSEAIFLSEGFLVSDTKETLFFGFTYLGVVLSYNIKTGNYILMHTIDKTPKPEFNTKIISRESLPKPSSCLDISIDNGDINILSVAGDGIKDKNPVMDVYDANTLKYKHSFRLPKKYNSAVVKNGVLYVINKEKNIIGWEMEKN